MHYNKYAVFAVALFGTLSVIAVFGGSASAQDVAGAIVASGDQNAWQHIKSEWLPAAIGWLLILQVPFALLYLAAALWVFFQEQKYDRIYDATRDVREIWQVFNQYFRMTRLLRRWEVPSQWEAHEVRFEVN